MQVETHMNIIFSSWLVIADVANLSKNIPLQETMQKIVEKGTMNILLNVNVANYGKKVNVIKSIQFPIVNPVQNLIKGSNL